MLGPLCRAHSDVVRDIAVEGLQIRLRFGSKLLEGDRLIMFAVLAEKGLARERVRQKASWWSGNTYERS